MKDYLSSFLASFDYPEEVKAPLLGALDKLLTSSARETFLSFLEAYEKDTHIRYGDIFKQMREVSTTADIHPYTGDFLLLALWTKRAREVWRENGYSEELFYNTFLDLRYKIIECRLVKGVWGTFVADWYPRFYVAKIFALGRLQFEKIPLGKCAKVGELTLTEKSPVLSIHIPRNGESMSPEAIDASLCMAEEFFRESFEKDNAPLLFHCHSWLLYPEHENMLKEGSNILAFSRRFTPIDRGDFNGYGSLWRYFDRDYNGDIDSLPTTNSLYRAYVERIRAGLPIGWGEGIIVRSCPKRRR